MALKFAAKRREKKATYHGGWYLVVLGGRCMFGGGARDRGAVKEEKED